MSDFSRVNNPQVPLFDYFRNPLAKPSNPTVVSDTPNVTVINKTPAAPADQLTVADQGSATPSVSLEPAQPQFINHTVKRGETLSDIAKKYLGDPKRFQEIFKANEDDMRNPNDLRIGMVLKIPAPAGTTVSEPVTTPDPVENTPEVTPTTPTTEPAPAEFTSHTVKRGESLSSIALRVLGDSERYMEIYNANRDQMKTPNSLQPGMTLRIPTAAKPTETKPDPSQPTGETQATDEAAAVDNTDLTAGAQELLTAMQDYQQYHAKLGHTTRTQTSAADLRKIAIELDAASRAFGVDPKLMLAVFAHESGGINPGAKSTTGAGGLGQLTSIAIRQVHFMAGIGKGASARQPYSQYKGNFVQNARTIRDRFDIKSNIWTSVAYMSYELNDRARLGRGIQKTLNRYGDPHVKDYAGKVNAEAQTLFGTKLY